MTAVSDMALSGREVTPRGASPKSQPRVAKRSLAVYTGATKAQLFTGGPSFIPQQNIVIIRITVTKAGVDNRVWTATFWVGNMQIDSPYISISATQYRPAVSAMTSAMTSLTASP